MDDKAQELLKQILANQVVIYKKLDQIEKSIKGSSRLASINSYVEELKKEAVKALDHV